MASVIHYACCHGSHEFVSLIEHQVNFSTALLQKTINGYTPYHVAVHCGNSLNSSYILGGQKHDIVDEYDNWGRSLLQLAIQHTDFNDTSACIEHIAMAISAKHNLYHVDIHGNFLHEAARKDHHYIFYHALTNSGLKVKQLRKLLRQQNKYGLTSLLVALSILPHSNPANIRIYDDLFVVPGVWNRIHLIAHSSTLQTFSNIMIYLKYTCDLDISQDMDILINLLVRKYQILYIVMIRDLYAVTFWDVLRILDCKDMYFYFSLSPTISYLFLSQNLTEYCYDTNSNDILHTIIMNYRNRFWQHFESDIIWEHYFNGYPALMLDRCYNKEGYNLLHKAAMGGNYKFVKFLINRGMDIKNINKDKSNYFQCMSSEISFSDLHRTHITNTQIWYTA
jgi:ankyrin repeat protein